VVDFRLAEGWVVMAGPKVNIAEPKVHVFDLCFAQGWVAIAGPVVYMAEPKVRVLDFSSASGWVVMSFPGTRVTGLIQSLIGSLKIGESLEFCHSM
jgi:hypothetical protein